ncbi:MAG: SDR family NAD(P)-dependent oxidoreductase, partial [Halobaculum sp.]
MSSLLDGQTAVVTGGASGIGRATAKRFAEEGADVVIADVRHDPRLEDRPTHRWIESETGSRSEYVECDVTEIDDLRDAVEAADDFGGIDTMVNNAGITGPMEPFQEASPEEYREAMSVILDGVFFGSKVAAAKMLEDGTDGSIVNMSSATAMEAWGGIVPYSGAKGGVQSLTHGMAADLGPQIRVNAVHPGLTE